MTRILILGGTGMLGHKLWQRLSQRFPGTYVTVRRARANYARYGLYDDPHMIEKVDATDFDALCGVLQRIAPKAILNCIGMTKRREPVNDPVPSILLNALLPHRLAAWGAVHDARVINFSTDCVFDGKQGGYTEQQLTNAEDLYGRTKALGEITSGDALTIRSSFIGRELLDGTELLEWFLAQQGKTISGYRNALYSGISTLYLADLVCDIIEKYPHLSGLYHVASNTISKYDLLMLARDAFGADVRIQPDDSVIIKRNLDCGKFQRATGYAPPDWRTMMAELATDPTPYADWRK
jgi:dTDP-4-dehydrorhamnose reductase